ncbi:hypothetical protein [Actinomadura rayongensis]|uniref:hypothetical protein n=1 Tax=Actinomadura rayongensis TaxID=1429076 RepID=UPI0019286860|nr:hypothetical protein [Actinomadura rayongensis]
MADDEKPIAIGEALPGIEVLPLPERWTALGGIVLVKCLDEEGHPSWAFRTTDGFSDEELLGALTIRTDMLRRDCLAAYEEGD